MAYCRRQLQGTIVISSGSSFAADLTGFSTGLLISGLLLILTLRAAKLPGTPLANIVVAVCGLLWSAGGLAETVLLILGVHHESGYVIASRAVRYAAVATVCVPILGIWRPYAVKAWQKKAVHVLYIFACAAARTLAVLLVATPLLGTPPLPLWMLGHLGGLICTAVLVAGAAISLRRESTPRAVYAPSLVIVLTGAPRP